MENFDSIFSRDGISENTRKAYKNAYQKILDSGLFKRRISSTSNENIISNLHQITNNVNSFAQLLNICIIVKRYFSKDDSVLVACRNNQTRLAIAQHHKDTNVELDKGLPSYSELTEYVENLYKK